jgi:hypothetical protein
MIDVKISSDPYTGLEEQEQWSKITRVVAGEGAITAYCYDSQPSMDLTFRA